MTLEAFVDELKQEFRARLFRKTGWGCHQAWAEFQDALSAALAKQTMHSFTAEEIKAYEAKR